VSEITVAIPVRDGGAQLRGVLEALARQTVEHELLVCDSGSTDGSVELAHGYGARVLRISPEEYGHGRTRNLLMAQATGEHVAMLSQDAEPTDERWLERMLAGFSLADDVAIAFGPYVPRPDAPLAVRLELERWFASLAPDGRPQIERLATHERPPAGELPTRELIGARGFFTDANSCIARSAWEKVPFPDVPYAEDRALAMAMLGAGYAKAYVPRAAVLHSHSYTTLQELRRCFDEWRGLLEVYGWREPASPGHAVGRLRGELGSARRDPCVAGMSPARRAATLLAVTRHNVVRLAGALLGSRADALPAAARRRLSLERRGGFSPLLLARGRTRR
jgi:rhamnosyltransferase